MNKKVLVTGGTGFLGMHIILQLLQRGYEVRTTIRSINSKSQVTETLISNGINALENLEFVEADLSKDEHWDAAVKGCDYVLSVASPFMSPKDENEVIRPAVEGIMRILKAARNADVQRVVMTGNFGAVGFSNKNRNHVTTEADWTDPNEKGLSSYEKSKLLAERAAWDFIKREGGNLEFATINPVAILGPSLSAHVTGSFRLLELVLSGNPIPNLPLNIVDVRDVADLHIRAMTNPAANGQRFIASADGQISAREIATLLKNKAPDVAKRISSIIIPGWVLNLAALFNEQAREAALFLSINHNVSNAKAKEILGWKPIASNEEAILAAVNSLIKYKIIK